MSRYDLLARGLDHRQCLFLNFGLALADVSWQECLLVEDQPQRYHYNLIRHVIGETTIAGRRVLEVGCGRGGNCRYLARYGDAREVIGLDLCRGNLALCRQLHSQPEIGFVAGDAHRLPFGDSSFDVVVNLESSHCYADLVQFLGEVRRVLRPGGIFCWADLWRLQVMDIDWHRRKQALAATDLIVRAEEDISEQVFRSLQSPDGPCRLLHDLAESGAGDRTLIEHLLRGHDLVRRHLALGLCDYRLLRLQKQR